MASVPGSRSGGKIVRTPRAATATSARSRTPYHRPAPPEPRSPNWLSRLVISPSRFIASGAGKFFSSVLDLESSPTSSFSATSLPFSSANDSDAEEVGTFDDENDNPSEGDVALSKPFLGNSKNKHMIEQLLMKESFSREECDRLIKIIRSRVVDPANDDDGDKRTMDIPNCTLGSDSPDLHSAAIMEAKKWLQENKSGLDSNSDIGYGSPGLNLVTLPQDLKYEGSPVDVAKSYMRTRPPWASSSIDHTKPQTPSGIQLFKEETPYQFGNNSTASSKLKRDSTATGSWSIQDEIRRVRSRATEDLLMTLPSSKIDWSAFAMENKNNANSSASENIGASLGERVHNSTNLVDATVNLTRGLGSQSSPDLKIKLCGFQSESVLSDPVNINFEHYQGSLAVQQITGTHDDGREITNSGVRDWSLDDMPRDDHLVKVNGISDTNGPGHQIDSVEEIREAINFRLHDRNHFVIKEKVGAEDAVANGFHSSGPSFNAGQNIEQNTKSLESEPNTIDSSQERTAEVVLEQEACKTLSESTDVPDVTGDVSVSFKEDDSVASGSLNSSSVYEVQQDSSQPGIESGLATTPSSIDKQKARRITTRYNRRGRSKSVK